MLNRSVKYKYIFIFQKTATSACALMICQALRNEKMRVILFDRYSRKWEERWKTFSGNHPCQI